MAPPKGNQFWKYCFNPGAPRKYKGPEALWEDCVKYFEWVEANPLKVERHVTYQGDAKPYWEKRPRAMLNTELCGFLNINTDTWANWRKTRDDLSEIIRRVDDIIWEQKFQGAAADLFNSNIIAQQLGLKTRTEHSVGGETLEEFLESLDPDVPDDVPESE